MKRTKMEKGITLIALIITIVVLLILAAVAISSIQENGILGYAQNAADSWNRAQANEAETLQGYLDYLSGLPKAPTGIEGVSVSGTNLTVKATGGTAKAGVKGYKYSVDGTNWSETLATNTGYVVNNVTAGENTIYAKTVDNSDNVSTEAVEIKVTSFTIRETFISPIGITFGELLKDGYAGQDFESCSFGTSIQFRDDDGGLWDFFDCTESCFVQTFSETSCITETTIVKANREYHLH